MPEESTSVVKGLIAGAIGGLVASWVMNTFMEKAGAPVQQAAEKMQAAVTGQQPSQPKQSSSDDNEPKVDATMKTADAVVSAVTGGRHLSMEGKQKGGPIVHYAFGAVMGAVYGAAAEYSGWARSGFGTTFASALFTGADLIAVPALNLGGSPKDAPASSLATPFSAHIVYGMTTEAVRRLVRAAV